MHSIVGSVSSRMRIAAEDVTSGAGMICTETSRTVHKTELLLLLLIRVEDGLFCY